MRRAIGQPAALTFDLTHAPEGTPLAELVRIAGTRWSIESLFEQANGEVAWTSTRYAPGSVGTAISPCMLALAYLAADRQAAIGGVISVNLAIALLPLTTAEVRRLLWHLACTHPPHPAAALHWSSWRRKHQQRFCRAHWHQRGRPMPPASETRL